MFFIWTCTGQNVYEITCTAFAKGRELNNVNYQLTMNDKIVAESKSRGGYFSFILMPDDGHVVLEVSKKDYVPKIIHLRTSNYPFTNEFEIQDIDLEFEWAENSTATQQVGEMIWSDVIDAFSVIKVDSVLMKVKAGYEMSENKLGQIYSRSVEDGAELLSIGMPVQAKKHFEIALLSKPGDEHALKMLKDLDKMILETMASDKKIFESQPGIVDANMIDKINRGEITEVENIKIDKNVIYRVQLGAFSKNYDPAKFKEVAEFKEIPYDDFTRCFSGEFFDINLAIIRKKEMVAKGFNDAWIVKMMGNERIGF